MTELHFFFFDGFCNIRPVVNVMVVVIVCSLLCNDIFPKGSLLSSSCFSSALCICRPPICVACFGKRHVFQTLLSVSSPLSLVIISFVPRCSM